MSDYLNWTTMSVSALKSAHQGEALVMKPPFQRNPVWTDSQKAFLIDSILRGFPIPELYLQQLADESGFETITVVDGQQRIRACLEYLEGRFSLDPERSAEWGELEFEELAPEERARIYNYKFVVRLLPDVPEEALRKIFARLNQNVVALNKQELRHATYWGDFIKTVEGLSEHDVWSAFGIFTANDIRRMLDVEFVSELVVGHLHGPQNKKLSLDKWYAFYEKNGFDEAPAVRRTFESVLGEIEAVLPDLRKTRWRKKSDFYTLFLTFSSRENDLPLPREGRRLAAEKLGDFASKVDSYLSTDRTKIASVKKYGDSVARAASDLSSRRDRQDSLCEWLAPVWEVAGG